jgi:hypothetical protein
VREILFVAAVSVSSLRSSAIPVQPFHPRPPIFHLNLRQSINQTPPARVSNAIRRKTKVKVGIPCNSCNSSPCASVRRCGVASLRSSGVIDLRVVLRRGVCAVLKRDCRRVASEANACRAVKKIKKSRLLVCVSAIASEFQSKHYLSTRIPNSIWQRSIHLIHKDQIASLFASSWTILVLRPFFGLKAYCSFNRI